MPIFSSTITDLVANKVAQPYYKTNGTTSDYIIADLDAELDNIGRQISFSATVRWHSSGTGGDFINLGWDARLRVAGTIGWIFDWADDGDSGMVNTGVTPVAGELAHWVFTFDGASSATEGTAILYKNGVVVSNLTSTDYHHTITSGAPSKIVIAGGPPAGTSYGGNDAETHKAQVWNKALTATEVKELYSGASVPFKYKGANQTALLGNSNVHTNTNFASFTATSNGNISAWSVSAVNQLCSTPITPLIPGKKYRISFTLAGSMAGGMYFTVANTTDLGSAGGRNNINTVALASGDHEFIFEVDDAYDNIGFSKAHSFSSTETLPALTNWSFTQIGAVAEYDGSGIASDKWFDKSGNDLHATVTGATVENAPSGDDGLVYEEGSWTPTLEDPDGDEAGYFSHLGTYTRVGRLVTFQGTFYINSNTGMSGTIEIHGLPYTSVNQTAVTFGELRQTDRGGSGNLTFLATIVSNTTRISMVINNGDGKANSNALQHTAIGYATQWFFGGTYEI